VADVAAAVDANVIQERFESGEMLLYKNLLLEDSGSYTEALQHLLQHKHQIPDQIQ